MRKISILMVVIGIFSIAAAQPADGAARLIMSSPLVEVQRVNTKEWIAVRETVLSSGDSMRTGFVGRARVVFTGGTEIIIEPNSALRIEQYTQADETQQLNVMFLSGNMRFILAATPDSEYLVRTSRGDIRTAGANISASQRSDGQLAFVVETGAAEVDYNDETLTVEAGEGWRFESDGDLSDVVPAEMFDELDSLLDGCPAEVIPLDNRRLPVYISPDSESEGVGVQNPADITRVLGTTEDELWYRIWYRGGAGWIPEAEIRRVRLADCPALREFSRDTVEDADEYIDTNVPAFRFCAGEMPPPDTWVTYTLQTGHTLFLLAERTGTTVAALALVNCIADPRAIRAGESLFVPTNP